MLASVSLIKSLRVYVGWIHTADDTIEVIMLLPTLHQDHTRRDILFQGGFSS